MLIVFLTNEEADGYYVIAWVGDNIHNDINLMFGDETTTFGRVVQGTINREYYAYSLGSNLAGVMDSMGSHIERLGLASSFRTQLKSENPPTSHLVNRTSLSMTEDTVNTSLEAFTEKTGIPAVIVVDTMENVFGKTIPVGDIITVLVLLGLMIYAIYMIVRAVKNRKNGGGGDNGSNNGGYNTNYNNGSNYDRGNYNNGYYR